MKDFDVSENHSIDWDELMKECKYLDSNNVPERLKTGWSVRYKTCGFNFYKRIEGKVHSFYLFDDWYSDNQKGDPQDLSYNVMTDVFDPTIHDFDPNVSGLFEEQMDSNTIGKMNMCYGYDQTIEQVDQQLDKLGV